MSAKAMQEAQKLVKQQRYDEARQILKALDTPLARSWLESLDGLGSGSNENGLSRRWLVVGLVALLVMMGGAVYLIHNNQLYQTGVRAQDAMGGVMSRGLQEVCDARGYSEEECKNYILSQALTGQSNPGPGSSNLPIAPPVP